MYQLNEINRPISEYSDEEFELQKEFYRKPSMIAIVGIKQFLSDLYQEGVFVRLIKNYETSPCAAVFPTSVRLLTGRPSAGIKYPSSGSLINVAWDFWRNEVIQHVIEPEVV
jgi:hypothetical protein